MRRDRAFGERLQVTALQRNGKQSRWEQVNAVAFMHYWPPVYLSRTTPFMRARTNNETIVPPHRGLQYCTKVNSKDLPTLFLQYPATNAVTTAVSHAC